MLPYFQTSDGSVTIYHVRWQNVLSAGLIRVRDVALLHADLSYGVAEHTTRKTNRRGLVPSKTHRVSSYAKSHDWPALEGDDRPYDSSALLALERLTALWGANNYASR